mmetsp:Transcript_128793/g.209887  ORF Transcript_128793/g.209887 Transcript_128793/m.209887 type:complete len:268 (-) Transcript_128793:371-1174(-)
MTLSINGLTNEGKQIGELWPDSRQSDELLPQPRNTAAPTFFQSSSSCNNPPCFCLVPMQALQQSFHFIGTRGRKSLRAETRRQRRVVVADHGPCMQPAHASLYSGFRCLWMQDGSNQELQMQGPRSSDGACGHASPLVQDADALLSRHGGKVLKSLFFLSSAFRRALRAWLRRRAASCTHLTSSRASGRTSESELVKESLRRSNSWGILRDILNRDMLLAREGIFVLSSIISFEVVLSNMRRAVYGFMEVFPVRYQALNQVCLGIAG